MNEQLKKLGMSSIEAFTTRAEELIEQNGSSSLGLKMAIRRWIDDEYSSEELMRNIWTILTLRRDRLSVFRIEFDRTAAAIKQNSQVNRDAFDQHQADVQEAQALIEWCEKYVQLAAEQHQQ